MNSKIKYVCSLVALACWVVMHALGQGILEPSLVFYGTIHNPAQHNLRMTSGTLNWQIYKASSGRTIRFSTAVGNFSGFSYLALVPCETIISGSVSSNGLDLSAASSLFDRSSVSYSAAGITNAASFVISTQSTFTASSQSRGRVERLDLVVSITCDDSAGVGMCDDWQLTYFGYIGVNPNADQDHDGMSNYAEFLAGTDPTDPNSVFCFIDTQLVAPGVMKLDWASTDGRSYTLLRTTNVFSLFSTNLATSFAVLQTNIYSTPPTNTFFDSNAPAPGPYFYRLKLE